MVYMYHSFLIHSSAHGDLGKNVERFTNLREAQGAIRRGHANLLCIVPILVYVLLKQARMSLIFVSFLTVFSSDFSHPIRI